MGAFSASIKVAQVVGIKMVLGVVLMLTPMLLLLYFGAL